MSSGRGAPRPAGGGPKRAFKPNLAVAGKRETPASENSQQRQTTSTANNRSGNGRDGDRGRGRGRGGRGGRGRGGGAADRPALIVSEGIFSSGLNDERAAGRSAAGGVGGAGESLRFGRGRVKNEQISGGIEGGLRSAATYEEEWLSGDEEADAEALADLVHVGFISDLNSGDLAPLALPLSEARIFIDEEPEKESAKLPAVEDSKEAVREQIKKQRQNQRRIDSESPTPQLVGGGPIGNAFDELNRKAKSVNEPADFVFMQLPDTLSDMLVQGGKLVKKEPVAGEEAMEINVVGDDAPSTSSDPKADEDKKHRRHCLDAFANGTKLGRVQILKSGKARLVMGNMTLDLNLATPIDSLQEIVGIETPPTAAPGQPTEAGQLCVLGTVKHRMTASQDIESLVAAYRR